MMLEMLRADLLTVAMDRRANAHADTDVGGDGAAGVGQQAKRKNRSNNLLHVNRRM